MSDVESSGSRRPSTGGRGLGGKVAKLLLPSASAAAAITSIISKKGKQEEKFFNPEEDIEHKREWTMRQQQQAVPSLGEDACLDSAYTSSHRIFEHFCVVGLPSELNVKAVSADIRTYQNARESGGAGMEAIIPESPGGNGKQYGLKGPALPAEIVYSFPEDSPLSPDFARSIAAFCHPHGVRPELLERTPSMSSLNEVIYGQPFQERSDHSFVFMMHVADPSGDPRPRPMYGVCCYTRELVHRPPAVSRGGGGASSRSPQSGAGGSPPTDGRQSTATPPLSKYIVAAPRCYCILSRHPFFSLHFRLLHTLLGLERLDRMTVFAEELALGMFPFGLSLGPDMTQKEKGREEVDSVQMEQRRAPHRGPPTATVYPGYSNTETSSTSGSSSDVGDTSEQTPSFPRGAEFVTPHQQAASTSKEDIPDESTTRAEPRWNDLNHQQQQQLLPSQESLHRQAPPSRQDSGVSPALSVSSYGSELATPSAPLLAASTPFFTPLAPNSSMAMTGGGTGRRATWHHGATSPILEGDSITAGALFDRLDSVKRVLDESRLELDARLALSPLAVSQSQSQSQSSHQRRSLSLTGPGRGPEPGGAACVPSMLTTEISEADSFATAPQSSSSPSAAMDMGEWVSATDRDILLAQVEDSAFEEKGLKCGGAAGEVSRNTLREKSGGNNNENDDDDDDDDVAGQTSNALRENSGGKNNDNDDDVSDAMAQLLTLDDDSIRARALAGVPQRLEHDVSISRVAPLHETSTGTGTGKSRLLNSAVRAPSDSPQPPPASNNNSNAIDTHFQEVPLSLVHAGAATKGDGRRGGAQGPGGLWSPSISRNSSTTRGPDGLVVQTGIPLEEADIEEVRVSAAGVEEDLSGPLEGTEVLRVYQHAAVPRPGQTLQLQPDPSLQPFTFRRSDAMKALRALGLRDDAAALHDVEAAQNLGAWTVAALCRCLSLDNVIGFLTAALLERQVVVFCPDVGLLSATILSLLPLLLPFSWQSLLLPVLPASPPHLDLLEAPVPFIVGVVYKTPDIRSRCGGLVRVNIYKDRVRNSSQMPTLPQQGSLMEALGGLHAELRRLGQSRAAGTRPVYVVSDSQQVLANCFMSTVQKYFKGLVADLKGYTITDVTGGGGGDQRCSILMKESFVESFPPRDRPFMRQFAETQMFAVFCDSVL